jgi:hypothetical protein
LRYYRVIISGQTFVTSLGPNGIVDPGAQQVEFDIIQGAFANPGGDAAPYLKISGVPLSQIGQSKKFVGLPIQIYGGMSKGLPLASPSQQGLLCQGNIGESWGNWLGTAMDLNFLIIPGGNTLGTTPGSTTAGTATTAGGGTAITARTPLNLQLFWMPGQTLASAAQSALSIALPNFKISVNISPLLVNNSGQVKPGFYPNLATFADQLRIASVNQITGSPYGDGSNVYTGIQLAIQGGTVSLFDGRGTTASNVKALAFQDLIGQPTWQLGNRIQITTVMRGDLQLGGIISLPVNGQNGIAGQVNVQGSLGFSQMRDTSIFSGNFMITQLRHIGNYKMADGSRWATYIDCVPATSTNSNIAQPPSGSVTIDSIDLSPVAPSTTTFNNGAEVISGSGGA